MSTLERAIVIATTAHAGQRDKGGAPYILHPLRVMLRTSGESERIAAVLHDVVEDTPITIDALREFGFSREVLRAVQLLTKVEGESYGEFIARAATDDVARRVKLADIADNMDLTRIAAPTPGDHARIERYGAARKYLEAVGRTHGDQRPTLVQMAPTIVALENDVTAEMVEAACPVTSARIYACDFYVKGIERHKDSFPGGYKFGRIYNVDHHAPVDDMAQRVTSTMLALKAIRAGTVTDEVAYTVINHTDCDSVLSSALIMGLLPIISPTYPDVHAALSRASLNADHTGEEDRVADLLQGLDEQRHGDRTDAQYLESLRNLLFLLDGKPLEPAAEYALEDRRRSRARAAELVQTGDVRQIGHTRRVAYGRLAEEIDGAFFVKPLPDAWVIMLASQHPDYPDKWVVKLRLGNGAPAGFNLQSLAISDVDPEYGGRWNAGSDKRGGGTAMAPEEYRTELTERVDQLANLQDVDHRAEC